MADRIPIITEADVHAMRKVMRGEGTDVDQKHAMRFIGEQLCRRVDSPYEPGLQPVDLGFELGRHWVGVMISNMNDAATLEAARAADYARANPAAPPTARTPTVHRNRARHS